MAEVRVVLVVADDTRFALVRRICCFGVPRARDGAVAAPFERDSPDACASRRR